jgi:peptidoglycan-associated lipoprotein
LVTELKKREDKIKILINNNLSKNELMKMKKYYFLVFCYLLLDICLSGCPKKPLIKPAEVKPPEIKPSQVKPPEVKKPEVKPPVIEEIPEEVKIIEPEIREKESTVIPQLKIMYFDFDKYDLLPEAQRILQSNADFLKKNPNLKILVEGHCCECGTVEYNLGLGDKRAKAVRDYYIQLGINPEIIATITYGEEKPIYKNVGPPDSPKCAFNRRAETKIFVEKRVEK